MEPGEGATLAFVVDRPLGTEGSPEPGPAVLGSLNLVWGGLEEQNEREDEITAS